MHRYQKIKIKKSNVEFCVTNLNIENIQEHLAKCYWEYAPLD